MHGVSGFQKRKIILDPRISSNISGIYGIFGLSHVQGPCAVCKESARGDGGDVIRQRRVERGNSDVHK